MNDQEELERELKKLKISASMDKNKKKSMKKEIRKHAAKRRRRIKMKRSIPWISTAAAVVVFSVILLSTFTNDESTLPIKEHGQSEYSESIDSKHKEPHENEGEDHDDPKDNGEQDFNHIEVNEEGTETKTIMVEGMEDERTVMNYTLEPYGIKFQLAEFMDNHEVEDSEVKYYSEGENAIVTMTVKDDARLEEVASDIQSEYTEDFVYTEEPSKTSQEENAYQGIKQHFSDPPQGYYVYQIKDDVLVIRYEYTLEAGDGMGPSLQALRESIQE